MMRVTPTDAPSAFDTSNCSRPRTRRPRRANSYTAALPMLPTPTTIASYDLTPPVNIEASAIVMSHVAAPSYSSIGPGRAVRWKESVMRVRHSLAALSAIALVAMLAPRQLLQAQDAAKGSMLMAEARKALGGEDKLAAI